MYYMDWPLALLRTFTIDKHSPALGGVVVAHEDNSTFHEPDNSTLSTLQL